MLRAISSESVPGAAGRAPVGSPTPAGALAMAAFAIAELLNSLFASGPNTEWTAQDIAILEALREAAGAAHERFQALRAGREHVVFVSTARLQAAARNLSDAALDL